MKTIWITTFAIITLLGSSCSSLTSNASTSTAKETNASVTPTSNPTYPLLKTTMGDFVIVSARLVEEAHENKAPTGYKFLLIGLSRPDLQKLVAGEFSFESFQLAFGSGEEVSVVGSDGMQTPYKGMGGWLDNNEAVSDDFVMGFLDPLAESYTLYWTDNPPIPLSMEK